MAAHLAWLKEYAPKYKVDIHAWVLITDHVHLLCRTKTVMLSAR